MLFAGIDGGQSTTTAAIGDGTRVLARGRGGPADEVGAGPDSTRLRDALGPGSRSTRGSKRSSPAFPATKGASTERSRGCRPHDSC